MFGHHIATMKLLDESDALIEIRALLAESEQAQSPSPFGGRARSSDLVSTVLG